MNKFFLKRHCVFFIALALFLICDIILIGRVFSYWRDKSFVAFEVDGLKRMLQDKERIIPDKYEIAIDDISKAVKNSYKFFYEKFNGLSVLFDNFQAEPPPENAIALFFEISHFENTMHDRFNELEIAYRDDDMFGFDDFFEKKIQPASRDIEFIYKQKEHINLMLLKFAESKSAYVKLLNVNRNSPFFTSKKTGANTFDPNVKLFTSDDFKFFVYEIQFESFTNTFRNFLMKLRESEVPCVVREIHCTPNPKAFINKQNRKWILHSAPTKFTLVVEFLDYGDSVTAGQFKK